CRYSFRLYHFRNCRNNFCLNLDGTISCILEKKIRSWFKNKSCDNPPINNPLCNSFPETWSSQSCCLFLIKKFSSDTKRESFRFSMIGFLNSEEANCGLSCSDLEIPHDKNVVTEKKKRSILNTIF